MSTEEQTAIVRRFNRSYTQRIGALEDSFLGLGLPLGAMRLLFEVGSQRTTVRALRDRLGLDSGYTSRLLRRLEEDGLVRVALDPDDRRRRLVTLTTKGRRRWGLLEARSQVLVDALLEPLAEQHRVRLTAALAEADLLVRAATVRFESVEPSSPPAREAIDRYFNELHRRFGFDAAGQGDKDAVMLRAPTGGFVVAFSDGMPVACGGFQTIEAGVGEIKRMWVDDAWRGAGLGSRLLHHLEEQTLRLDHHVVRLDTNQALIEAITMYGQAGYHTIDRYNDNPYATHFFEKRLVS